MTDYVPRKPKLTPSTNPRKRPSAHARGYTREHQHLRDKLLSRHPICELCGNAFATDAHHTCGDSLCKNPDHLQALCKRCHDGLKG